MRKHLLILLVVILGGCYVEGRGPRPMGRVVNVQIRGDGERREAHHEEHRGDQGHEEHGNEGRGHSDNH